MRLLAIVVGGLTILATVIPFVRKDAWWIRIFDFPRSQIVVVATAAGAVYLLLRENTHLAGDIFVWALIGTVLYQTYMILPYTVLFRPQVQRSTKRSADTMISLLVANVLMDNRQAARLLAIIRDADPDLIFVVETDKWWQAQLRELERTHPFTTHCPLDNTYGMLLYSRLELVESHIRFLVEEDVPSIHAVARLRAGKEVELHLVHPRPPSPTQNEQSTERDAELLVVGKAVKDSRRPVIVAGDLNDVAWSRTTKLFQEVSGLLDPRVGRGFYNTFHAKYPMLRWPLDHVFHSQDFRLVSLERLPRFGSDHFPVCIALSYEPTAAAQQKPPEEADQKDRAEAEEKIAEGRRHAANTRHDA